MAFTTPRDWTVGEIVTEAMMDAHIKDNLRYLKGLDGATTLSDALILPDGAGYYVHLPGLTTTQRDALTATAGMIIYNTTTTAVNVYENGVWVARNDIAKMIIASQAQGDVFYASSATAIARLGAGTSGQFLKTQGAAANPAWGSMTSLGTYTGDGTANRAIPHGFGITPKLVKLMYASGTPLWEYTQITGLMVSYIYAMTNAGHYQLAVTVMDATNFYVGNATNYDQSANYLNATYTWVAIS